jgi:hypothetical protein
MPRLDVELKRLAHAAPRWRGCGRRRMKSLQFAQVQYGFQAEQLSRGQRGNVKNNFLLLRLILPR